MDEDDVVLKPIFWTINGHRPDGHKLLMSRTSGSLNRNHPKSYDYLLKFLLVGDSDVGKQEILSGLEDGSQESPFCGSSGKYKVFYLSAILRIISEIKLILKVKIISIERYINACKILLAAFLCKF